MAVETGVFSKLYTEWLTPDRLELVDELRYHHATGTIRVPAGFRTDLDSVPRIPFLYAWLKGRAVRSAVVHDYLYAAQAGRAHADAIFLDAMADEGVPAWRRYPIYWGVRTGGGCAYRRHANRQEVKA